jgi:hypothetical protein
MMQKSLGVFKDEETVEVGRTFFAKSILPNYPIFVITNFRIRGFDDGSRAAWRVKFQPPSGASVV